MKSLKLIAASLLAVAVASSAFAYNVKMTGSTAIRKAVYSGIVTVLTNESGGGHTVRVVSTDPNFNNKTPDGAQQAVFINDLGNTVQVCLSGSVGGISYVVDSADLQVATAVAANGGDVTRAWLAVPASYAAAVSAQWPIVVPAMTYSQLVSGSTVACTAGNTLGSTVSGTFFPGDLGLQSLISAANFAPADIAHITMSDSLQNSTPYDSGTWGLALHDEVEGTVTFAFCKGAQASNVTAASYGRLTNITAQNAQALASKGIIDLYQITGNVADTGIDVIFVGRNDDSGTRLGVFAETGIGSIEASSKQYIPRDANGVDASQTNSLLIIKDWVLAPGEVTPPFVGGYDSGAFVKQTLSDAIVAGATSPNGRPFIEVAYVSAGDLGGTTLTYNGVAMNQTNVIQATYTLWTTEHLLWDATPGVLDAANLTFLNSLKTSITATVSNGNYVNLGGLQCSRIAAEGSTVLHN